MHDDRKNYTVDDIQYWVDVIEEKAREWKLPFRKNIYQLSSHNDMIGYMAYSGLPSHYPHWSFGQTFHTISKLYRHAVTGLPYEMVINSDPCLVYLMRDNTLDTHLLTIAHAGIGHNAVFENNYYFKCTNPKEILSQIKLRSDRIRSYIEDPSIGYEAVNEWINALHALSWQRWRHFDIKKLNHEEQCEKVVREARQKYKEDCKRNSNAKYIPPNLDKKFPLEPEEDILCFIRDNHPYLKDWQKDLITIIDDLTGYFIPQVETKIVNEGFASYIHNLLLNAINLPEGLSKGIIHANAKVLARPEMGGINPYNLGFELLKHIHLKFGGYKDEDDWRRNFHPENNDEGWQRILQIMRSSRDSSFLRQYLDGEQIMRKLGLFQHMEVVLREVKFRYVDKVPDEKNWREVKETLITNIGMSIFPVIKIVDSNLRFKKENYFYLTQEFDGRELDLEFAMNTLKHFSFLTKGWRDNVMLKTVVQGKKQLIKYNGHKIQYEKI